MVTKPTKATDEKPKQPAADAKTADAGGDGEQMEVEKTEEQKRDELEALVLAGKWN